jgi:adenine/guanine phosphoribosyltransferase-like PRPP-binding protein
MRTINLDLNEGELTYPIGSYIQKNLPIIKALANAIRNLNIQQRIIFCCMGSSGAIIAAIVASEIPNSTIYHIKKDGESAHSSNYIELFPDDYIILIDDFISSGATMHRTVDKLTSLNSEVHINCIALGGSVRSDTIVRDINPDILILNENGQLVKSY